MNEEQIELIQIQMTWTRSIIRNFFLILFSEQRTKNRTNYTRFAPPNKLPTVNWKRLTGFQLFTFLLSKLVEKVEREMISTEMICSDALKLFSLEMK